MFYGLKKVLIFILDSIFFASFFWATFCSLAMHEIHVCRNDGKPTHNSMKGNREFTSSSESMAIMATFLSLTESDRK